MRAVPSLPGLARLIETCNQHNLPLELSPPLPNAPQPGEMLFGQPLDPLLAAAYQSLGGATIGELTLYRPDMGHDGLIPRNEYFKRDGEEPFRSILVFGKKTGFSYFYGTVPALANDQGLQPVVYATYYALEVSAIPIASTVDRFFDTYSRYLELMVVDPGYVEHGVTELQFPWGVPQLIAEDKPLMNLASEGRFSHLIVHDEGARDWMTQLLSTRV